MHESLWDLTAGELLGRVASDAPSPGGGVASAAGAAFGLGLVVMAIEITARKHPEDAAQLAAWDAEARGHLAALKDAADADARAFGSYVRALRLPKDTPDERAARAERVREGAQEATETPFAAATAMLGGLRVASECGGAVHASVRSDVAAGAALLEAGVVGACCTARMNLGRLAPEARAEAESRLAELSAEATRLRATALALSGFAGA